MGIKRRIIADHDFYCTSCGNKGIPVIRDKQKIREQGHLKKLYCIYCNKECNHAEVVESSKYNKETFLDEYNSGNFDSNGNRIIPLSDWIFLYYGKSEYINPEEELMENDDINEWLQIFDAKNDIVYI